MVGQADRIQTVTLDLFSEQVATVEAREYQPGKFAVDVTLKAPCAKALAELTKTHMGSYFRLKVAGQEALFAQVYQETSSGQISLESKTRKAAKRLASKLQPVTHTASKNAEKARCSTWQKYP